MCHRIPSLLTVYLCSVELANDATVNALLRPRLVDLARQAETELRKVCAGLN